HLGQADLGIISLRRYLLQALRDMAAGSDPPGLDPASHHIRSASMVLPAGVPFTEETIAPAVQARPDLLVAVA
ncbi:MAG TPA: hypothetical protein VKU60_01940, partial [Chloroflexota bacterium]|nr:hypothetical protein [Chloroflexota bacterium]